MNRKAIEMSLQTVIIALLVMIVAVIIIMLLTGQTGRTRINLNKTSNTYSDNHCEAPGTGRICVIKGECYKRGGISIGQSDCGSDEECCS